MRCGVRRGAAAAAVRQRDNVRDRAFCANRSGAHVERSQRGAIARAHGRTDCQRCRDLRCDFCRARRVLTTCNAH